MSRTTLGITIDCYQFGRRRQPAFEFAQYCDSIGAGGIQIELAPDLDYAHKLRQFLEQHGMFFDAIVSLPKESEVSAFELHVKAAKEAGAVSMRAACLGGRRYEVFNSLDDWKRFVQDSHERIQRAVPIAQRYRIPLGIENHKDWTVNELSGILKAYSSEWLGVCLDTGNNLALLDSYRDVIERLAPYTINTHLKDMSLAEYPEGILLVEPVLGKGFFDIPWIVATIRNARPAARFTLEMITRNPLKVPVFTDKYWVTFPDRNGRFLADSIATARSHGWSGPLPEVEQLPRDARIRVEEQNVIDCLSYAREYFGSSSER